MTRSSYPIRLCAAPPAPEIARRYLLVWWPGEIVRNPHALPPLTAAGLFNRPKALLEIDIGCGTGELALQLAAARPDCCVAAFDRAGKPLYRAVAEAHARGLTNIKFIKTDFRALIPYLQPSSLAGVYYHFPPPYRKMRHCRTGIFSPTLLSSLAAALHQRHGFLSVMTDDRATFDLFLCQLKQPCGLAVNVSGPFRLSFDRGLKSFHHVKWENKGRNLFRLELYPEARTVAPRAVEDGDERR